MSPTKASEASPNAYEGPRDDQPLTEKELAILLAVPRAAEKTPDATAFRIPLGVDPSKGWIDVTWSEARSIVARLAATWTSQLPNLMAGRDSPPVGLAFWALGCTTQFISLSLDDATIDLYLRKSDCQVVIYSDISESWVDTRREAFRGSMILLPENEYAYRLAEVEKHGRDSNSSPPWPEPRRPAPAVILHSSATTGVAKLLSFSLYYYTLSLPEINETTHTTTQHIANPENKTPHTHPFLIFSAPYWQSFHGSLFSHLVSGTPTAFAHVPDIMKLPSEQLVAWARGLDVGGVLCAPRFLHRTLVLELETNIAFLRSLYTIVVCGATIDSLTCALIEKHGLRLMNAYGCTEIGGVLCATQAPYTHLRMPSASSPLIHPIMDTQSNGSRQVQLWHSLSTSPQLAHLYAKGGVPLAIEPYPGSGPHAGEPAINLGDIFEQIKSPPNSVYEFAYVHLGRSDDRIDLRGGGGWCMNTAPYEIRVQSLIESRHIGWTVDAVQLFGSDLPCTVLVIQISASGVMQTTEIAPDLGDLVAEVNKEFQLGPRNRVHTQKRLLVITPDDVRGPNSGYVQERKIRLSTTHKHTLQRWKNVQALRMWLGGLDFSEP